MIGSITFETSICSCSAVGMGDEVLRQKVDGRQYIQPTHRTLAQRQFNLRAVASLPVSQKPQNDPRNEGVIPGIVLSSPPAFHGIGANSEVSDFRLRGRINRRTQHIKCAAVARRERDVRVFVN